ncbi:hypothetical protein EO95_09415 [Methanosarcina sp. 1.H.T.1A.1]|uniref:hypothetical protein n=1 Tax=Methanosarcina sp. 1.H.T.1A.1 TaxID=1483602 RepID=UPI0006213E3B|nr:hypothetical protein [Methanosarcina sp. 1.H.T.1A.1]KKH92886.1 hypothetical protein EO95_09415 [Methanosarcina sp. 1.H.T.1A.1]
MAETTYFKKNNTYAPEYGQLIICPQCSCEETHMLPPEVKGGHDNHEAWQGRGSAIFIPMYCENGHAWDLRIGFHKGQCFMDVENVRNEWRNDGMR